MTKPVADKRERLWEGVEEHPDNWTRADWYRYACATDPDPAVWEAYLETVQADSWQEPTRQPDEEHG
jgi:hypothetical protein